MMLISIGMTFISAFMELIAFAAGGFLIACTRLYTYKNGKLWLFMRDKTLDKIECEYDEEQTEEKYKEVSINSAVIGYIIGWLLFLVVMGLEIVLLIK